MRIVYSRILYKFYSNIKLNRIQRPTAIQPTSFYPKNVHLQSSYLNSRNMATNNGTTTTNNATTTTNNGTDTPSPREEGHVNSYNSPLKLGNFTEVVFSEAQRSFYPDYRCAAHVMLYAFEKHNLWNRVESPGHIMMQIRFDGSIGFPGGLVDPEDPDIIVGLNRELAEEIGLDPAYYVTEKDHVASHVNTDRCIVTHFFAKELTPDQFKAAEKGCVAAPEWGSESLGVLRVPLYTMEDNFRGFPVFLANRFAGNARDQLIMTIRKRNILTPELLDQQLESYRKYTDNNNIINGSGSLNDVDHYATQTLADYERVSYGTATDSTFSAFRTAAHAMFYYVTNDTMVALMHQRFDGYLGFPGGIGEPNETPEQTVNRETTEEMGHCSQGLQIKLSDHVISHVNRKTRLRLHFYAVEINADQMTALEKCMMTADEYGKEVLGPIRLVLKMKADNNTDNNMFAQQFIGNTKDQIRYYMSILK